MTTYQLAAWARVPGARIVAIADLAFDRAQEQAAAFSIPHAYPSAAALLDSEAELDFIDIATPPGTHQELVALAIARGLPINCQKPFAPDLAQARAMIATCCQAGVLLNINENWRWRSWFREARDLVAAGAIGRPVYFRLFAHGSGLLASLRPAHPRTYALDRLILYEWGIHHFDVLRFLFGEPRSIYARTMHINQTASGEDRAVVILNFDTLVAVLDYSWSSYAPHGVPDRETHVLEDIRIEGERGTICLYPDPVRGDRFRLTTADGDQDRPAYSVRPIDAYLQSYVAAQAHFIDCLRTGSTPETSADDNFKTLAAMLAAYHSAECGQVVDIAAFQAAG